MGLKRSRQDSVSSSEDLSTPFSREQSADIKFVQLDADSALSAQPAVMKCSLPPHEPLAFASFQDYDVHYQKTHLHRCSACDKNFPDQHFLYLHIAEYHDPINASKRDQGEKTYACLISTCDRLCSTPQKRRLHCIDKHQFPRNYDFIIVKDGIDRRNSMLIPTHRRRSSTFSSASGHDGPHGKRRGESVASAISEGMDNVKDQEDEMDDVEDEHADGDARRYPTRLRGRGGFGHAQDAGRGRGGTVAATYPSQPATVTATPPADPMAALTSSMSSLQFVPHSVRATRGKGRGRGG